MSFYTQFVKKRSDWKGWQFQDIVERQKAKPTIHLLPNVGRQQTSENVETSFANFMVVTSPPQEWTFRIRVGLHIYKLEYPECSLEQCMHQLLQTDGLKLTGIAEYTRMHTQELQEIVWKGCRYLGKHATVTLVGTYSSGVTWIDR